MGGRSGKLRQRLPAATRRFSVRQRRFILEYQKDGNAARAARAAGYSEKTADRMGYENLRKPEIAAAIRTDVDRRLGVLNLELDRVLEELGAVALVDPLEFVDERGQILAIVDMPVRARAALRKIKAGPDGVVEVEFWNKLQAVAQLVKIKGYAPDSTVTHDVTGTLEASLKAMLASRGVPLPPD